MNADKQLKFIKKHFNAFLKKNPEARASSVGYVVKHLHLNHMKASLYLETHHQMMVDAYNLHDVIVNYNSMRTFASAGEMVVFDGLELEAGRFNPSHLIEYFKVKGL